ncbi:MAG: hypothetical protein WCQ50_17710 [Spirochaetota bacterium]
MRTRSVTLDEQTIASFDQHKVLTADQLGEILQCSPITVHRRLKEWKAHTSYNQNGRYHTLPSIPVFNAHGIWQWQDVFFSRYGTLKESVIQLAAKSPQGLDHRQLKEILGLNPKCFLSRYEQLPGIRKEQHHHQMVYFSADDQKYDLQKRRRFPPVPTAALLPDDAVAILVLVTLIRNPKMDIPGLAETLRAQGHAVPDASIAALFESHGIGKKKLTMRG